jgi:RNA polymerase sigma-70 factor (ECF subfamily)
MAQEQHLSHIATQWSIVRRAHSDDDDRLAAQQALLERYGGAVRRYLLASLRDADAADEVFQDFALRFVRGDFHRAHPDHGKFRSFLKTVISRMIIDYHRGRQRRRRHEPQIPEDFPSAAAPSQAVLDKDGEQFLNSWREDVLARCWDQLRRIEATSGRPLYTVLRHRVEHPHDNSQVLAEQLSVLLGRSLTAANVRVMVHRARDKFAALLLKEIADSLEDASVDLLEQELIELRLHDYCRNALISLRQEA